MVSEHRSLKFFLAFFGQLSAIILLPLGIAFLVRWHFNLSKMQFLVAILIAFIISNVLVGVKVVKYAKEFDKIN
jgi:hypothetical protein